MSKTKSFETKLYANMSWFTVAEQPSGAEDLPPEFAKAQDLWEKDGEKNLGKIIDLLQPFLKANFILESISNWNELFDEKHVNDLQEIAAESVKLTGVDFSEGPIPKCNAEAVFATHILKDPKELDLDEWQSDNSPLSDGVSFSWDVPRTDDTEDLDLTFGDHSGVECIILNEP